VGKLVVFTNKLEPPATDGAALEGRGGREDGGGGMPLGGGPLGRLDDGAAVAVDEGVGCAPVTASSMLGSSASIAAASSKTLFLIPYMKYMANPGRKYIRKSVNIYATSKHMHIIRNKVYRGHALTRFFGLV